MVQVFFLAVSHLAQSAQKGQEANENERERKKERKKCDCRDGEECPLKGECVLESVVYKANVIKENGEKIDFEKIEISQQFKRVSCCNFVRLIDWLQYSPKEKFVS